MLLAWLHDMLFKINMYLCKLDSDKNLEIYPIDHLTKLRNDRTNTRIIGIYRINRQPHGTEEVKSSKDIARLTSDRTNTRIRYRYLQNQPTTTVLLKKWRVIVKIILYIILATSKSFKQSIYVIMFREPKKFSLIETYYTISVEGISRM